MDINRISIVASANFLAFVVFAIAAVFLYHHIPISEFDRNAQYQKLSESVERSATALQETDDIVTIKQIASRNADSLATNYLLGALICEPARWVVSLVALVAAGLFLSNAVAMRKLVKKSQNDRRNAK